MTSRLASAVRRPPGNMPSMMRFDNAASRVHLAFGFNVRRSLGEQVQAFAHRSAEGESTSRTSNATEGDARLQAETLHLLGRHLRDLRELFGRRLLVDVRVGDEQGVLGQHQHIHGREHMRAGLAADDVGDILEMARKGHRCRTACRPPAPAQQHGRQ